MKAEGWYRDPFEVHRDRWFSDGEPTGLVRDGEVESTDPPPADEWHGPLVDVDEGDAANGDDLRRADDPRSHAYNPREAADAAIDAAAAAGLGFS